MGRNGCCDTARRRVFVIVPTACLLVLLTGASPRVVSAQPKPNLAAERKLATNVSETRMVETVRRLVRFGTRMYGTPSNHETAAWLASEFKQAGLEVTIRQDPARDWYQPISWEVRILGDAGHEQLALTTTWPSSGSPSGKGTGLLSTEPAQGAVCLTSTSPTPETTAGCAAVLFDGGRMTASGWPGVNRLRGTWNIPVFAISQRESRALRDRLKAGEKVGVSFGLEGKSGKDEAQTVVATLPGRDHSKYILFCAHGDSDSGGPGADDNASGVAIVLEIARMLSAAVKSGLISCNNTNHKRTI